MAAAEKAAAEETTVREHEGVRLQLSAQGGYTGVRPAGERFNAYGDKTTSYRYIGSYRTALEAAVARAHALQPAELAWSAPAPSKLRAPPQEHRQQASPAPPPPQPAPLPPPSEHLQPRKPAAMSPVSVLCLTDEEAAAEGGDRDCPISLQPLSTLDRPPFRLCADAARPDALDSDLFDGKVLAEYLTATANFTHPLSRRALARVECEALDAHLRKHGLAAAAAVARAFDERHERRARRSERERVDAQRLAAELRASLFAGSGWAVPAAGATDTPFSTARGARPRDGAGASGGARSRAGRVAAVVREGGLTMVDDDLLPSHATETDVDAEEAELQEALRRSLAEVPQRAEDLEAEAYPPLPRAAPPQALAPPAPPPQLSARAALGSGPGGSRPRPRIGGFALPSAARRDAAQAAQTAERLYRRGQIGEAELMQRYRTLHLHRA